MRIGLLLVAALIPGCEGAFVDEDGNLCVGADCNDGSGGGAVSDPITFSFDRPNSFGSPWLALDGVIALDVQSPAQPHVSSSDLTLAITSEMPHRIAVDVTGKQPGGGTIHAEAIKPDGSRLGAADLSFTVAQLVSIVPTIRFLEPPAELVVLPDIREIELRLLAAGGESLIDHSLVIDPSSDPGFTQKRWDVVGIPETPGDHILAVTRRAGDLHHVPVRVVDHVDAIVADESDFGRTFGTVCVSASVDGQPVTTRAWEFASDLYLQPSTRPDCIDFFDATPGATLTVTLAGSSAQFVIVPSND